MPLQGIPRKKRKKRNRPVFRHGMPPKGIPRNKIQDLEEVEGKKGPEMSANIAKVTRIFLAS